MILFNGILHNITPNQDNSFNRKGGMVVEVYKRIYWSYSVLNHLESPDPIEHGNARFKAQL